MTPNFLFAAIYFMFHKYSTALYINDTYFFKLGFTPRKYGQSGCCESINNKKYHSLSSVVYFTSIIKFQYQILKCSMFP